MDSGTASMNRETFNRFVALIYEKSGITLNDNKEALVSSRIAKRMRKLGIANHRDYLRYVLDDTSGEEIVNMLDVISTNVTHFFRESQHFDFVQEKMDLWLRNGDRRFTFWSAGCSSGEEPYTMAMVLREVTKGSNVDLRILATDISTRILARSKDGVYDAKKAESIPRPLRDRYFDREGSGEAAVYSVKETLRSLVTFKRLNLSVVPFPMKGPMDFIFCRNVMIYFDNRVRVNLLGEFHRLLKPGGYLCVGHAESLTGMLGGFKAIRPSVYVKT
ncbi:MAG: protein-glutamate O-methyltransferase [Chitinispirillaceae bacterium]|nr:protein-glutamate O-methyltransferase [Chitinispirillaceae bacterium]